MEESNRARARPEYKYTLKKRKKVIGATFCGWKIQAFQVKSD